MAFVRTRGPTISASCGMSFEVGRMVFVLLEGVVMMVGVRFMSVAVSGLNDWSRRPRWMEWDDDNRR